MSEPEPPKPKRRARLVCLVASCAGFAILTPCLLAATPLIVRRSETPTDELVAEVAPGIATARLKAALESPGVTVNCRSVSVATLWDQIRLKSAWKVAVYEREGVALMLGDVGASSHALAADGRTLVFQAHPLGINRIEIKSRRTETVTLAGGDKIPVEAFRAHAIGTGQRLTLVVAALQPYANGSGRLVIAAVAPEAADSSAIAGLTEMKAVLEVVGATKAQ